MTTIKRITEETEIAWTIDGNVIKADRLQKWAYNQLFVVPALVEACQYVIDYHRKHDSGEGELFGMDYVTTCINVLRLVSGGEF